MCGNLAAFNDVEMEGLEMQAAIESGTSSHEVQTDSVDESVTTWYSFLKVEAQLSDAHR
jgi:hypothetical protein